MITDVETEHQPAGSATPQERILLAAIMISGRLPNMRPRLTDFTPGIAARIWRAVLEMENLGLPISCLSVWRFDPQIDPVELAEIQSEFPVDLPSRHLDLYVMALEGEVRRKREAA